MGYFRGKKIPDYNPFWEEPEYQDKEEYWHWYHLGHNDGYQNGYHQYGVEGSDYNKLLDNYNALKELLKANARVSGLTFEEYCKQEGISSL